MSTIFDDRPCLLGEGPLWHPGRGQLYWFDILGRKLMTRTAAGASEWRFEECCSAAAWIDHDRLLIASESALSVFDLASGSSDRLCALEAGNPATRSNDGRADPWGGFWIGTMGKKAESGAGAIYRHYRGEVRRLFAPLSIPNAISFTPDRRHAHFADSAERRVWRVALDEADGWPKGDPVIHIDLNGQPAEPDGAVCDADGHLWLAHWGAAEVGCYSRDGQLVRTVAVAAKNTSCPAFGGADYGTLFVTSARQDIPPEELTANPQNGCTWMTEADARGLPEYRASL